MTPPSGIVAIYRPTEDADASAHAIEGAVVESIGDGEWLNYTVNITANGVYALALRYASDNAAGGGPLYLELDGPGRVGAELSVPSTGGWTTFRTATLNGVELTAGRHVLRLNFRRGELNVGPNDLHFDGRPWIRATGGGRGPRIGPWSRPPPPPSWTAPAV